MAKAGRPNPNEYLADPRRIDVDFLDAKGPALLVGWRRPHRVKDGSASFQVFLLGGSSA